MEIRDLLCKLQVRQDWKAFLEPIQPKNMKVGRKTVRNRSTFNQLGTLHARVKSIKAEWLPTVRGSLSFAMVSTTSALLWLLEDSADTKVFTQVFATYLALKMIGKFADTTLTVIPSCCLHNEPTVNAKKSELFMFTRSFSWGSYTSRIFLLIYGSKFSWYKQPSI